MPVIRRHHNQNYTVMSNYHFKDKNLSLKAKGLLSMMLSLPEDWDYTVQGLATLSSDGITAVRTALQELEEHHYLYRQRLYENGKIADIEYHIFEKAEDYEKCIEELKLGNPILESVILEGSIQLNTNKNKRTKENKKTKDTLVQKPLVKTNSSNNTVQEFVDMYNDICKDNPELSSIRVITDKRKAAVMKILKKFGKNNIVEVMHKIENSDFLLGKTGGTWHVSFDWLFNETNFVKVLEGNYDSKVNKSKVKAQPCHKKVRSRSVDKEEAAEVRRILEERGEKIEY